MFFATKNTKVAKGSSVATTYRAPSCFEYTAKKPTIHIAAIARSEIGRVGEGLNNPEPFPKSETHWALLLSVSF